MDSLLPNFSLLKSPSNWFLVGFAMALIALIFHACFKDKM